MGVQGLWKLLEPTGRAVVLESLQGKILAVGMSVYNYGNGLTDKRRYNRYSILLSMGYGMFQS